MLKKYNLDDEFWDAFGSHELVEELQRLDKLSRFGQKPHYITVTQSASQLTKNKKQDK